MLFCATNLIRGRVSNQRDSDKQELILNICKYFTLAMADQKTVISVFYWKVLMQDFPADWSEIVTLAWRLGRQWHTNIFCSLVLRYSGCMVTHRTDIHMISNSSPKFRSKPSEENYDIPPHSLKDDGLLECVIYVS